MRSNQAKPIFYSLLLFSFLAWAWAVPISRAQAPDVSLLEKVAVYPSLILHNGKIATMDQNMTFHQAMAIRGERVWKLGADQELRPLAGPQTELVDLKGRTVVPGLRRAHPSTSMGVASSRGEVRCAARPGLCGWKKSRRSQTEARTCNKGENTGGRARQMGHGQHSLANGGSGRSRARVRKPLRAL